LVCGVLIRIAYQQLFGGQLIYAPVQMGGVRVINAARAAGYDYSFAYSGLYIGADDIEKFRIRLLYFYN